jgi:dihydrofolate synthase/folylpolyglutamate synthase
LVRRPAGLPPVTVEACTDPVAALHKALAGADPADRILVFGSFYTVGGVLQQGLPRLGAAHLG